MFNALVLNHLCCVAALTPTTEHSLRVTAALRTNVRSTHRLGSNRVPNGTPASSTVDLSGLNHVLGVDHTSATPSVTAEPGVTMKSLVAATLPFGLVPKVVPEFSSITVGGAIAGGAMESGSVRHGMFHDTISSCELLLPNRSVVTASLSQHADLFTAIGGSYGVFASITAATIECVRASPYVSLRFTWHSDIERGVAELARLARSVRTSVSDARPANEQVDFLDAVALPPSAEASSDGGVLICAASFVAARTSSERRVLPSEDDTWSVGAATDEWYYEKLLHLRDALVATTTPAAASATACVRMGVEDYLFRFDRGAFNMASAATWLATQQDQLHPTKRLLALASANQPLVRRLCGRLFETASLYRLLRLAPAEAIASQLVLQDVFLPPASVPSALDLVRRGSSSRSSSRSSSSSSSSSSSGGGGGLTCPVWMWPVRGTAAPPSRPAAPFSPNGHVTADETLINLGLYGRSASGGARELTRELERFALANGGRKLLYSASYYTDNEMWSTYDRERHDELRRRTGADVANLPSLPEKVCSVLRQPEEMSALEAAKVALARWLL